jgi:hypothetical protein
MIKYAGEELANSSSQKEASACCPDQLEAISFDPIHAGNLVMQSCVRFYPKKNLKIKLSVLGDWTA